MGHKSLACALGQQMEMGPTPSRSHAVRPHAPEAFKRIAVVPTMGGGKMEAELSILVVEGRGERVGPVAPAARL
jgi:hypothetical protein